MTLDDLTVAPPPAGPADWNDVGVVELPGFFQPDELAAYITEWRTAVGFRALWQHPDGGEILVADEPLGVNDCAPFMWMPEMQRLVCDGTLATILADLIGDDAACNQVLNYGVTTERGWHQDGYLLDADVGDHYASVWIALGDVHPDSGPFQYVPGSHRWPQVTRQRILEHVDETDYLWPKHSEDLLTPLFEAEIEARGATVATWLPKAGDVLVWHGRLLHRGSVARTPGLYRPALIGHYSGRHHRAAMPTAVQHDAGGWYFPITNRIKVR